MSDPKAFAIYGALCLVTLAIGIWLFGLMFPAPAERQAVLVSAGLALVVQLVAFAAARHTSGTNPFAGWGVGLLLRFAVLAIYGLIVVDAYALPSAAALLSLATFFFISTLVEPPLLRKP